MWSSKDEILRDLANVNGVCTNVDDDHLVKGFRPPPPSKINEDIDDEFNLRFGGYGDQISKSSYDSGPDLVGIQKMLRLVNNKPEDTFRPSSNTHKDPEVIVISKLNPNVKEFVPKSKSENKDTNGNIKLETSVPLEKKEEEVSQRLPSKVDDDEQERQKMAALLKSKISTALKDNSFEKKREKNVAMAALLRLNSGPPKTLPNSSTEQLQPTTALRIPTTEPPKESTESSKLTTEPPKENIELLKQNRDLPKPPLVLFTPDYFAGPSRTPKEIIVDDSEHTIPEPKPLLDPTAKSPSPRETHDPIIKESIDKVNNWLNSPDKKPKPKAPVPYIGPVTFKKKESITPKSPCSEVSKKTEGYVIPKFVPSQNAAKLAKDFEAQVKAKEETEKKKQPPVNMWTELDVELKKRDEIIRNRSREQLDGSSRSLSTNSNSPSSRHN
ncbi:hypothetical protein NE865_00500 [Phthorimaea operculella]|nr:hypothetical protein NE865_00500 [Phthorimaea operculella]